ncbi:MAG: hemolysin family protein [Bacilli bacterium]
MGNLFILVLSIIIALGFSAFFSASEMAYTAVNPLRLKTLVDQGNALAKKAARIAQHYDQYSSALLFGNGIVNILNSSLTALIAIEYLAPLLPNPTLAATIMAILFFFIIVIIGELIPKSVAKIHALTLSLWFVYPVMIFRIIFSPFVFVVSLITFPIRRLFVQKRIESRTRYNDDELETMVDTIEAKGVIDEKKGDLIRSALTFSEKKAYEAMTPRVDMFAFNIEEDSQHLLLNPDIFAYSRIPIYDQTLDKIIGFLPTKKLYKRFLQQSPIDLASLMTPPLFVPRNQPLTDVLGQFKEQKQQIAIVVDEHGGTEGLITLEDIAEELVGEIWDETDDILPPMIKQSDREYLVEGSVNIEVFFHELDIPYEDSADYATVSGWVINQLGDFARVGDRFTYEGFFIEVLEVEKFTVEKIKVTLPLSSLDANDTEND